MIVCYDIETDNLLDKLTKVHVIGILVEGAHEVQSYHDDPSLPRQGSIAMGLEVLELAEERWAHGGASFDEPALRRVYPGWSPRGIMRDSLIAARVVWPGQYLKEIDATNVKRGRRFPGNLIGRHSLEAWGHRLRDQKGESPSSWAHLTADLVEYNRQDCVVLSLLRTRILAQAPSIESLELETEFARICAAQESRGFRLDGAAVADLTARLTTRRAELNELLRAEFPDFRDTYTTPKKHLERERITPFNPISRAHIARGLQEKRGWKPQKFTPTGQPQVDEEVMATLPWPEARLIAERLLVQKRLGQVAEGAQAWHKLVQPDGRVHGRMAHNDCVTARCAHSRPNVSAIPKVSKPWGPECRRCWVASPGHKLVIVDAAGIDARMIAHYSYKFDGGEFAKLLLESDIHTRNAEILGCPRDAAKAAFYGILYSAQGKKVGQILGVGPVRGKALRQKLLDSLPGLNKLIRAVEASARQHGWLRTLDGRRLWVRKPNAALNTLAQGAAAITMKRAVTGAGPWTRAYQVAFVHDEIVCDVPDALADECAAALVAAVKAAGEHYRLKIPLDAHAAIGVDWSCK